VSADFPSNYDVVYDSGLSDLPIISELQCSLEETHIETTPNVNEVEHVAAISVTEVEVAKTIGVTEAELADVDLQS
jgi:hypothetical protein